MDPAILFVLIGVVIVAMAGSVLTIARCYKKVKPGYALVIGRMNQRVTFSGAIAVPILDQVDVVDIRAKSIEISRHGTDALRCEDGAMVELDAQFIVRVNKTKDDILNVLQTAGAEKAGNLEHMKELFTPKFVGALQSETARFTAAELGAKLPEYRDRLICEIGQDLNGYVLEDVAVELKQTTSLVDIIVGQRCLVRSVESDGRTGRAELDDKAKGVCVHVRSQPMEGLREDRTMRIKAYDEAEGVFEVEVLRGGSSRS